jgi:hypothetical protein
LSWEYIEALATGGSREGVCSPCILQGTTVKAAFVNTIAILRKIQDCIVITRQINIDTPKRLEKLNDNTSKPQTRMRGALYFLRSFVQGQASSIDLKPRTRLKGCVDSALLLCDKAF